VFSQTKTSRDFGFFLRCELQRWPRRCIHRVLHRITGTINQTVKEIMEVLVGVEAMFQEEFGYINFDLKRPSCYRLQQKGELPVALNT
jgi:hypothetical protein